VATCRWSRRGKYTADTESNWGWIYLHDQQAVKEPAGVGTVVIPPQPVAVRAGTLLGHPGEYVDYETSTPLPPRPARQLLHLEVFADDTLGTFIEKSRARAAQLPQGDRSILMVRAGAKLVAKPADADFRFGDSAIRYARLTVTAASPKTGHWVQVQPWIEDSRGPMQYQGPLWIARSDLRHLGSPNGLAAWKSFPLKISEADSPVNAATVMYSRTELNAAGYGNVAIDDHGVAWWRIEVDAGAGKSVMGWMM